nr:multiple epidermal growth factor-like domains protein 10 [Crassostrea gigas]
MCPTNCKDNRCRTQNGTCFTCKPGWTGTYCKTKCTEGWYGVNCSQQCSGHCKDGTTCNHVTGQCDRGCDKGWTGSLCVKECVNGTYGYDCVNNCSGHCLNSSPCKKQTGHCDRGCNPGYTDKTCSKKCIPGQFGVACSELCSDHCINNGPCDHVSGVCSGGCQDGYLGAQCFNSCTTGFYGKKCSVPCPPSCNVTCEHTDGSCNNCKEGSESHCSKERIVLSKNVSSLTSWIIVCIVSLVVNCVLISGACLLCRGIYTKKLSISGDLLSRSNKSIYYTDIKRDVKTSEFSTYQELDLSREEIQYQNTTI